MSPHPPQGRGSLALLWSRQEQPRHRVGMPAPSQPRRAGLTRQSPLAGALPGAFPFFGFPLPVLSPSEPRPKALLTAPVSIAALPCPQRVFGPVTKVTVPALSRPALPCPQPHWDTMRIRLLEPISGIYGSYAAGEEASAYCKGNHLTGSPRNACAYLHLGVRALLLEEKLLYPRKSRWAMSELRGSSPKGEFNPTIT